MLNYSPGGPSTKMLRTLVFYTVILSYGLGQVLFVEVLGPFGVSTMITDCSAGM